MQLRCELTQKMASGFAFMHAPARLWDAFVNCQSVAYLAPLIDLFSSFYAFFSPPPICG